MQNDKEEPPKTKGANGHYAWTYRTVAGHVYRTEVRAVMFRLEQEHRAKGLDIGESVMIAAPEKMKHFKTYQPALTEIWNSLSKEDQEHCETLAKDWNEKGPPDNVKHR